MLIFSVIWFTAVLYLPICHMVWGRAATCSNGALDFAGGTVVLSNAGIADLVSAWMVGKRISYGREALAPQPDPDHGRCLAAAGWAGSASMPAPTSKATAGRRSPSSTPCSPPPPRCGVVARQALIKGKPSMLGAASGAVAGLVAITPACGSVGPMGAIVIGTLSGFICIWA